MERKIIGNIGLKILAVALSISLWFYVTYRGQSEVIIDAPVEFKNVPAGLELIGQNIKTVSMNIRGHERLLKGLRPHDVRVVMDMSDAKRGEGTYIIDVKDVVIPRTVKVLRVDPSSVRVVFDQSVSKVLPVRVPVTGVPQRGYMVSTVSINPPSVTVEGARSEVARIAALRTEPIDITGFDSDVLQNVRINTTGVNIRTKVSEVAVRVVIRRIGK